MLGFQQPEVPTRTLDRRNNHEDDAKVFIEPGESLLL